MIGCRFVKGDTIMKMNQKRYSEAFKRHVCEEIKEGKWSSTNEAAKAYNIGTKTVIDWVDELGCGHLRQRRIEVKTPKEVSEIARLKAELKKTKEMFCDEVLKIDWSLHSCN